MFQLIVGVGRVSLRFRHARSLKEKRNATKSLVQRLRNQGFSVTEAGDADEVKQGTIGFAFAGSSQAMVVKALDEALRPFLEGNFEIMGKNRDIFDYSDSDSDEISEEQDLKYGL